MIEYKLIRKGGLFIKVDRLYPSTQLCSCCGYKNPELKDLSIRNWKCPKCGSEHDRDENAVSNLLVEGKRILVDELKIKII